MQLQKQVLALLAQLVQLRVNYCLLDSDQVGLTQLQGPEETAPRPAALYPGRFAWDPEVGLVLVMSSQRLSGGSWSVPARLQKVSSPLHKGA